MENTNPSSTRSIIDKEFASVKTMFEGFNIDRKLVYANDNGHEYGSGDPSIHGTFFVFITVPDLNLEESVNRGALGIGNPFARHVLAEQLYRKGRLGGNFIKLFTNTAMNAPFQDINLDNTEVSENWDGVKLTIAKNDVNSTQSGTVNLRLRELAGNPVLNTINIWHNYINAVVKGRISPTRANIDNRILDYASTIYVFTLGQDHTTIEYAAKYSGCYPASVPAAAGSNEIGDGHGPVELDVPFTFNFYESMNGVILEDFNRSSKFTPMGKPDLSMASVVGSRGELLGDHAYLAFQGNIPYITTTKPAYTNGTAINAPTDIYKQPRSFNPIDAISNQFTNYV